MSSSSDLETGIAQQVAQKKKKSSKKKFKSKHVPVPVQDQGKNEGDDPHSTYEPPEGAVLIDHTVDVGPFEWDTVGDDSKTEIWLIRVPDSIKAKHLEGLEIDSPSSSRTACIGSLIKKNASFDVWSLGNDDTELAGGDELRGLSCLLPRKRNMGKLYLAPKPISRHLVISAQPPIATVDEHRTVINQDPPRPSYPKDVLKHAFVPYGARSERIRLEDLPMDIDPIDTVVDNPTSDLVSAPKVKTKEGKESKGKKRKIEGDLPKPKKLKKHKADT